MNRLAILTAILLLTACAPEMDSVGQAPPLSPVGSGIARSTPSAVAEVAALSETSGTWIGGNADFFRDARAHRAGDIITVKIEIDNKASLNSTSNRSRKSSADAGLGFNYDLMGVVGADVNGEGDVSSNSSAAGQGSTARSERIDMSVAAIVTQVLPNGYLLIEGSQELLVNFEQRALHVAGRSLMTRAGTPTTVQRGGTAAITTAPAPTMASAPISIRLMIVVPVWTWQHSRRVTLPAVTTPGSTWQHVSSTL